MTEFLWRKQVFPFGRIDYKGRTLDFTPAYLGDIAGAFAGGAFDLVPFVDEGSRRVMTNDLELYRGEVRALEVVSDGMDALVAVGAETDARLEADPELAVAPRLIENYRTSHAGAFPVAMASLHVTRSPMFTGLRPWTRETRDAT